MSLKRAISAGVKAALNSVRDLMVEVEWTFVTSDVGEYDPETNSFTKEENVKKIMILFYDDKDDDNQVSFSSRGNFIETPTQLDKTKVLIGGEEAGKFVPGVNDTFVDDLGQHWSVENQERVPGDSVYVLEAIRT